MPPTLRAHRRRRYSAAHRGIRRQLAPLVAGGKIACARCGELIAPNEPWDLDHRDDGRGWLGASHRRCNGRAGWQRMIENATNRSAFTQRPPVWSVKLYDDPPVGTVCCDGIYVGGGRWVERPQDCDVF